MARRRVGVAMLVPGPVAGEIDGLRRAVGDGALGRMPPHLTLVPPVNVREDAMGDAIAVLRRAAAGIAADGITVVLGPPATFLPVNPVLFLSVGGRGLEAVHHVRDAVFAPPLERALTWPFVPHITLADELDPPRIEAAMAAFGEFRVEVTFEAVHILEEGDGRIWHPIAEARFGPPAVIGRGGFEIEIGRSTQLDEEAERWTKAAWDQYSLESYGVVREDEPFALCARRPHDGRLLGTATGSTTGADGYLANLIVDQAERNAGVGTHLLAATEALAAERGCARLTLRTLADGEARRFYERHGWRAYATLPRWRHGRDFVQMERILPTA